MQNIRHHIINSLSVVLFAFVLAVTVNSIIRRALSPSGPASFSALSFQAQQNPDKRSFDTELIMKSNFFKRASLDNPSLSSSPVSDVGEFILLGTITGPSSVARALIKKRTENESKVYPLWSDVSGYKLVRIENTKVYLKQKDQINIVDMFARAQQSSGNQDISSPTKVKQTLSRSDMQQKIKNNMDTMLQGLRAGPYRVNGKIDGYKLFQVSNDNFLYTIGARSGDIIKRINGHPIDSTDKLYKIWSNLNQESRVVIDLDRAGKIVTFDYTFSE